MEQAHVSTRPASWCSGSSRGKVSRLRVTIPTGLRARRVLRRLQEGALLAAGGGSCPLSRAERRLGALYRVVRDKRPARRP